MGEFAFQTLRESITSAIRSKILTGELQPGAKLAEQRLAEEFGSSRAPIREALRQLEQEGMVEYSRNVGCSVRRVKPEDAYEIYLLRANLEMTALRYFDCKFPEEDLRTLRGILEEMRNVRPGDLSKIAENDNRFHAVIVQRAGLPRLLKFWNDLNYGNLLVGVSSGSNHEILAQRLQPRGSGAAAERHPHQAVRGAGKRRHRGGLPRRLRPLHGAHGADAQRKQRRTGSGRNSKIRGIWLTV